MNNDIGLWLTNWWTRIKTGNTLPFSAVWIIEISSDQIQVVRYFCCPFSLLLLVETKSSVLNMNLPELPLLSLLLCFIWGLHNGIWLSDTAEGNFLKKIWDTNNWSILKGVLSPITERANILYKFLLLESKSYFLGCSFTYRLTNFFLAAFAPMNGESNLELPDSDSFFSRNQPFDTQRYFPDIQRNWEKCR